MKTTNTPKWKVVENVVTAIERSLNSIQGTKIIPNTSIPERVSGKSRQVDVYVEVPTGPRVLRIGIEVRDKAKPLDLPEVEQLIAKLSKLDIDYGCIVSRAGFAENAKAEAIRNGIELRTVVEVENPSWWRVPSLLLKHKLVELLDFQLNFRSEDFAYAAQLLTDVIATDVDIILASGETIPLKSFVEAKGIQAIEHPELIHLIDQDTFNVVIEFSDFSDVSLKYQLEQLPLPQNILACYRLHDRVESIKLSTYQGSQDIIAITGLSSTMTKQITFVAKLQSDGSRSISVTSTDPTPPKIKVDQRMHNI